MDADLFILSGGIEHENADTILHNIREIPKSSRRTNAGLFLTTSGGDADAGYRLVNYLKNNYKKLILFVFGWCKSAGTFVVLGADEIVISEFGELGPLDVQVTREDELTNTSGLCYYQELTMLRGQALQIFEQNFLAMKHKSGHAITTRTAAEISVKLATALLSPIASQIDPLRLGEVERSINIAKAYGKRLGVEEEILLRLILDYPTHGFDINMKEAQEIFGDKVREPDELETRIETDLFEVLRWPLAGEEQLVGCIHSKEIEKEQQHEENKQSGEGQGANAPVAENSGTAGQNVPVNAVRENGEH